MTIDIDEIRKHLAGWRGTFLSSIATDEPAALHFVSVDGDESYPDEVADIVSDNGDECCESLAAILNAAPALLAEVDRLTAARDQAVAHRAAINEEIKKLHTVIKSNGFSVEDSIALTEIRYDRDRLTAELAAARTLLDSQRAEIASLCADLRAQIKAYAAARDEADRLRGELAAARAVPADVEALADRIRRLAPFDCVATNGDGRATMHRLGSDAPNAVCSSLQVAYVLQDALIAVVAATDKARATAPPATVGALLATAPVGSIVEWRDELTWRQVRGGEIRIRDIDSADWGDWWPTTGCLIDDWRLPARRVSADQADLPPDSRGPIGGGS